MSTDLIAGLSADRLSAFARREAARLSGPTVAIRVLAMPRNSPA